MSDSQELSKLEAKIIQLVQKTSEIGLPRDMPAPTLDKALSKEIVELLLALQKLAVAASTNIAVLKITEMAKTCEIATQDVVFRTLETYVNRVGDRLASFASDVGNPERLGAPFRETDSQALSRQQKALQIVEAHMKTLWEFYRRVKNTQLLAISMVAVARKIQDGEYST